MFLNIIIKSLKNKRKVDVFNLILKVKRFKLKSNIIFLLKIKKNNKRNVLRISLTRKKERNGEDEDNVIVKD